MSRGVLIFFGLALFVIFASADKRSAVSSSLVTRAIPPAKFCTCNDYVTNRIPNYPNDSASGLAARSLRDAGFVKIRFPQPGAIALYQGSAPSVKADPAGHVEVVEGVTRQGVVVATSGMNIPATGGGENGCLNVKRVVRPLAVRNDPAVSYWMPTSK